MGKVQSGLTHVEENTLAGKEDIKKKYLENVCHDDNRRKFSQTSNTPLMHGRISQEIGLDGTSGRFLNIMQGHYNEPPDIGYYTISYLKHLRIAPTSHSA